MKKWKIFLLVVIIIILTLAVSGWLYFKYKKQGEIKTPEQQKIQKQLMQLEALKQQYNLQPPTQQQIQEQLNRLGQLRQKYATSTSKSAPVKLTQQQIQQQLNELQNLKK